MRLVHRTHQRSTSTANVTLPQATDLMFSEVTYYSETITISSRSTSAALYGGPGVWGVFTYG